MRKYSFLCFLLATGFISQAQTIDPTVLTGHWEGKMSNLSFSETWIKTDDSWEGHGIFIDGKDTVAREKLSLQKTGDHWVYTAIVNENPPVPFTLVQMENNTWVFENTTHDYPSRIVYQFKSKKEVLAYTEGTVKGKHIREDYLMKKTL